MCGCSKQPFLLKTLEDYSQRIGNVLEKEHQLDLASFHGQINSNGASTAEVEDATFSSNQNIKLREFYNLPDCGIKPLIAERNTTMGKLQLPSQRYLYDLKLVNSLRKCLEIAKPEDQIRIQTILAGKQQDKRNSWRALITRSKEIRLATTSPSSHFDDNENHDFAILNWQQLLTYAPDKTEALTEEQQGSLEQLLKTISDYKTPAKLNNDSGLIASVLPQVTNFLQSETSTFTCNTRKETQKVEYLRNVFHLFFIEKIQPLTSNMNKWYYKLEPVLEELKHPLITDSMENAFTQQKARYDESLKEHVQFWQQLFKRCNVSPSK